MFKKLKKIRKDKKKIDDELNNKEKKEKKNDKTKINFLRDLLKESLKNIAIAIGTLTIGLIAFYLSPLKEKVAHIIWEEKAGIYITPEVRTVKEGGTFAVDIIIFPKSIIEISEGFIKINYPSNMLKLLSNQKSIKTAKINKPTVITESNKLHFMGINHGIAPIEAHLFTRYGDYKESVSVEIVPQDTKGNPLLNNFSGIWSIKIGHFSGKMELKEKGGVIQGNYFLKNGHSGVLDGIRDGTVFKASFYKGSDFKWEINASWKKDGDFLEISGKCIAYQDKEGWQKLKEGIDFYAVAHLFL